MLLRQVCSKPINRVSSDDTVAVLRQYHDTVSGISKTLTESIERSANLNASYQPEADMRMFIERHRTGPFRPTAQVYESVAHDECDVVVCVSLRKFACRVEVLILS